MLKQRILSTLKFFDLQDIPLTLMELHRFLLGDLDRIRLSQDENWELFKDSPLGGTRPLADLDEILVCLENQASGEVKNTLGYYHLPGRAAIVHSRLANYFYGVKREKRISRFLGVLRLLPFVRGAAVGGSQSLGQQKEQSDIDLLILVDPQGLWLARTMVSLYFQILALRRHGRAVANRFCLNHYIAQNKAVNRERNLYKAMEYVRLRPIVQSGNIRRFLAANQEWIWLYFPNFELEATAAAVAKSNFQRAGEALLKNPIGKVLEWILGFVQRARIHEDEFTFVLPDELSFHPHSQHRTLLNKFFVEQKSL